MYLHRYATRSQSYDRELQRQRCKKLQRQRCKKLQRHEQPNAFGKQKKISSPLKKLPSLLRRCKFRSRRIGSNILIGHVDVSNFLSSLHLSMKLGPMLWSQFLPILGEKMAFSQKPMT
jgi:hypothetical protein